MGYGHAERNLALIRQLEAETRELLARLLGCRRSPALKGRRVASAGPKQQRRIRPFLGASWCMARTAAAVSRSVVLRWVEAPERCAWEPVGVRPNVGLLHAGRLGEVGEPERLLGLPPDNVIFVLVCCRSECRVDLRLAGVRLQGACGCLCDISARAPEH